MEYTTNAEFLQAMNLRRLTDKNKWFFFNGTVAGKRVQLKSYNTYLQICEVDGKRKESGVMDMPVKAWKAELEKALA